MSDQEAGECLCQDNHSEHCQEELGLTLSHIFGQPTNVGLVFRLPGVHAFVQDSVFPWVIVGRFLTSE